MLSGPKMRICRRASRKRVRKSLKSHNPKPLTHLSKPLPQFNDDARADFASRTATNHFGIPSSAEKLLEDAHKVKN